MTFPYMSIYTLNVFNPPAILLPRLLLASCLFLNSSLPIFTFLFLLHIHEKRICLYESGFCTLNMYDL